MIFEIEHPLFYYEHLLDSHENIETIKDFAIREKTAFGLELYLKQYAENDEKEHLNSTYLVKDKRTNEIVGYFTLKTALFTLGIEDSEYFESIPSIELSNFAVNSLYRANHPEVKEIGKIILTIFVIPLIKYIRNFVAVKALYIYALPSEKLINHYESLGFHRLSPDEEAFVHAHVKPKYDDECIFMYQIV